MAALRQKEYALYRNIRCQEVAPCHIGADVHHDRRLISIFRRRRHISKHLYVRILIQPTNSILIIDVWVDIADVRRDHDLESQGRIRRHVRRDCTPR